MNSRRLCLDSLPRSILYRLCMLFNWYIIQNVSLNVDKDYIYIYIIIYIHMWGPTQQRPRKPRTSNTCDQAELTKIPHELPFEVRPSEVVAIVCTDHLQRSCSLQHWGKSRTGSMPIPRHGPSSWGSKHHSSKTTTNGSTWPAQHGCFPKS